MKLAQAAYRKGIRGWAGSHVQDKMMTDKQEELDRLRSRIDQLDREVHDRLTERARIVADIGRQKTPGQPPVRPARELALIQGLLARNQRPLADAAVIAIWREIIGASVLQQGPIAVAVHTGETGDAGALVGLARDHFGAGATIRATESAMAAIRAIEQDPARVLAVFRYPSDGEDLPWWRLLAGAHAASPKVVASLPLCGLAGTAPAAMLVMQAAVITPADRSLLVLLMRGDLSRDRLRDWLGKLGLRVLSAIAQAASGGTVPSWLIEIDGTPGQDDPRLAAVTAASDSPVDRVLVIGSYQCSAAPTPEPPPTDTPTTVPLHSAIGPQS